MRKFPHKLDTLQAATPSPARPQATTTDPDHLTDAILNLQRSVGNQAVQRMLEGHPEEPKTRTNGAVLPPSPRSSATAAIQPKLAINEQGDACEQEAESVAEQVRQAPEPPLQRSAANGEVCTKNQAEEPDHKHVDLQTQTSFPPIQHPPGKVLADKPQIEAPATVDDVLSSSGQSLDSTARSFMESRFGNDLSDVRVHTNSQAADSARAVGALAYTVGQHIVFDQGQYSPGSTEGRHLLAHELTHVAQQTAASIRKIQRQPRRDQAGWRETTVDVRWSEDEDEFYSRVLAAIVRSPDFRGIDPENFKFTSDKEPWFQDLVGHVHLQYSTSHLDRKEGNPVKVHFTAYYDREHEFHGSDITSKRLTLVEAPVAGKVPDKPVAPPQSPKENLARHKRAKALGGEDAGTVLLKYVPALLPYLSAAQIEQVQLVLDAAVINPDAKTRYQALEAKATKQYGQLTVRGEKLGKAADRAWEDQVPLDASDKRIRLDHMKVLPAEVFQPSANPDETKYIKVLRGLLDTKGIWLLIGDGKSPQLWISLGPEADRTHTIPAPDGLLTRKALLDTTTIGLIFYEMVTNGPAEQLRKKSLWPDHKFLTNGTMEWKLQLSGDPTINVKFTPDPVFGAETITFLQTVLYKSSSTDKDPPARLDFLDVEEDPFYGMNWDAKQKKWVPENTSETTKIAPSSAADRSAYLYDVPWVPPSATLMFETVAVVPKTAETLGALRWGVGEGKLYGAKYDDCTDKPSTAFNMAVERFYATPAVVGPAARGPKGGEEGYDAIVDGFKPNDATLTTAQEKLLDPIVTKVKADPTVNVWVGGFADAMDKNPGGISEERAQAVANYLVRTGVPRMNLSVTGFGSTWARYPQSAGESRNRRVQCILDDPGRRRKREKLAEDRRKAAPAP